MSKKRFIYGLALTFLIVLVFFYIGSLGVDEDKTNELFAKNSQSNAEKNEGVVSTIPSFKETISAFQSSSDSKSALALIDELSQSEQESLAKHFLKEMHSRCQHKDSFSSPSGDDTLWHFNKLKEYCEDYDSSLYHQTFELDAQFKSRNPDIKQLVFSEEIDIDIISENFLNYLLNMYYASSDFMIDVSQVLYYYGTEFDTPLELGQSDSINAYDIQRVQMAAIELFACQQQGGCGPNSYNVLMNCIIDTSCQQGWSLMDYYQNTLSPNNFNEVMNILNFIQRYQRTIQP